MIEFLLLSIFSENTYFLNQQRYLGIRVDALRLSTLRYFLDYVLYSANLST